MIIVFVSSLLGVAALSLHVADPEEPFVSVWPPGSKVYLGEYVLLQCRVESNSTVPWTYSWYRNIENTTLTLNLRPWVSGDSYSITAITREDAGNYWCRAKQRESNITTEVKVVLHVSDQLPPSLALTPNSRQIFSMERFTLQCPDSVNSTGWGLKHFLPGRLGPEPKTCSPPEGAVSEGESKQCVFIAASGNGGLYWCEGLQGRSSAVNITVSYGNIVLKAPSTPVYEGYEVVLYCQYRGVHPMEAIFFKDGEAINSPNKSTILTIKNVTQKHEGFYSCASTDGKMQSPESWLSISPYRGNFTSKEETAISGWWKWIIVPCVVLLLLIPPSAWLVQRFRYQMFCPQSCWVFTKEDIPVAPVPATKQDVTEVQWDLSWMEMSSLLDKQLYPGT